MVTHNDNNNSDEAPVSPGGVSSAPTDDARTSHKDSPYKECHSGEQEKEAAAGGKHSRTVAASSQNRTRDGGSTHGTRNAGDRSPAGGGEVEKQLGTVTASVMRRGSNRQEETPDRAAGMQRPRRRMLNPSSMMPLRAALAQLERQRDASASQNTKRPTPTKEAKEETRNKGIQDRILKDESEKAKERRSRQWSDVRGSLEEKARRYDEMMDGRGNVEEEEEGLVDFQRKKRRLEGKGDDEDRWEGRDGRWERGVRVDDEPRRWDNDKDKGGSSSWKESNGTAKRRDERERRHSDHRGHTDLRGHHDTRDRDWRTDDRDRRGPSNRDRDRRKRDGPRMVPIQDEFGRTVHVAEDSTQYQAFLAEEARRVRAEEKVGMWRSGGGRWHEGGGAGVFEDWSDRDGGGRAERGRARSQDWGERRDRWDDDYGRGRGQSQSFHPLAAGREGSHGGGATANRKEARLELLRRKREERERR